MLIRICFPDTVIWAIDVTCFCGNASFLLLELLDDLGAADEEDFDFFEEEDLAFTEDEDLDFDELETLDFDELDLAEDEDSDDLSNFNQSSSLQV